MALEPGTRFDQYEILCTLGAGAMGEVYKAKDVRLDRIVAVKIITATRDLDPQARDRFDREARALAALSHPHICNVYHYGEAGGTPYLVMEYLEGQTVGQRLRAHGKIPPSDMLRYGTQIAEALQAAHHAGIVHRDLKPENVMLTAGGAKLLDLGVSKRLPDTGDRMYGGTTHLALTRVGTITGTVPYMAPEQLEGHPPDVRSDIFSFGAVLYEMATGRRAFKGASEARIIASIMSEDPARASSVDPALPVDLDAVLERCLKKAATDRYQTASDLLAAIRQVREDGVGIAPSVTAPADTPAEPRRRRRRRLVISFSIGISFSVLLLAVALQRRTQPAAPATVSTVAATVSPEVRQLRIDKPEGGTIVGPGGVVCGTLGSECTVNLPDGTPVALSLQPDPGHVFVEFTGDCVNGTTAMTGERRCGGRFARTDTSVASQASAPGGAAPSTLKPVAPVGPPSASTGVGLAPPPATALPRAEAPPPAVTLPPTDAAAPSPAPPPIAASAPLRQREPALTPEEHARKEIEQLVKSYCDEYESLQSARIQKLYPLVDRARLDAQLGRYRSLTCTVTGPPEFDRLDASPAGGAQVKFGMTQVIQTRDGGAPATTETIVTMVVSRVNLQSPWVIDRVQHALKPKP